MEVILDETARWSTQMVSLCGGPHASSGRTEGNTEGKKASSLWLPVFDLGHRSSPASALGHRLELHCWLSWTSSSLTAKLGALCVGQSLISRCTHSNPLYWRILQRATSTPPTGPTGLQACWPHSACLYVLRRAAWLRGGQTPLRRRRS